MKVGHTEASIAVDVVSNSVSVPLPISFCRVVRGAGSGGFGQRGEGGRESASPLELNREFALAQVGIGPHLYEVPLQPDPQGDGGAGQHARGDGRSSQRPSHAFALA